MLAYDVMLTIDHPHFSAPKRIHSCSYSQN